MTRRAYLYFLATFLLGVVVGCVGTYMYGWYSGHWHHHPNRQRVVRYLKRELGLSESQTQQLKQIVDDMTKKDYELHKQLAPQFRVIRQEARNRTRQILNPQQLQKFNELVKRWDERAKKRMRPPQ